MTSPRILLVAGAALVLAAPASAATWQPLTAQGSSLDEAGLARLPDGTLFTATLRHDSAGSVDLIERNVGADGIVLAGEQPLVSGWANLTGPELLVNPDNTVTAVFAGQRSADKADPYSEGRVVTVDNGTLGAPVSALPGPAYAADRVAATKDKTGALMVSWGTTFGETAHVGTDPNQPNTSFQDACCAYGSALATDSAGTTAAWYTNEKGAEGVKVRTPDGQTRLAPGATPAIDERIGLAARSTGDGTYVAYPTAEGRVNLWRTATPAPVITVKAPGAHSVALSAGPDGRLWIAYVQRGRLKAARTNPAATRLGAVVTKKSSLAIDALATNGATGPLDVVATRGETAGAALTRVLPGLTLTSTGTKKHPHYKVTDAGDPVKGAKLTKTKHRVTASKAGYTSASLKR